MSQRHGEKRRLEACIQRIHRAPTSIYQDKSIAGLKRRGVVFPAGHTAMEEQSRIFIQRFHFRDQPKNNVRDWRARLLP